MFVFFFFFFFSIHLFLSYFIVFYCILLLIFYYIILLLSCFIITFNFSRTYALSLPTSSPPAPALLWLSMCLKKGRAKQGQRSFMVGHLRPS